MLSRLQVFGWWSHITFLKKLPFLVPLVAKWVCQSWGSVLIPLTKDGHDPALDITMPRYSGNNTWPKDVAINPAGPIWGYHCIDRGRLRQRASLSMRVGEQSGYSFLVSLNKSISAAKWWDQYTWVRNKWKEEKRGVQMGTTLASGSSPKLAFIPEYGPRLYVYACTYKIEKLHTLLSVSK